MDEGTSKNRFESQLDEFFRVFNGRLWLQDRIEHFCSGPKCCESRKHTVDRMVAGILSVLLRHLPCVTSASKWTKLGPCVDFMIMGSVHGLLLHLWKSAFHKLSVKKDVLKVCRHSKHRGVPLSLVVCLLRLLITWNPHVSVYFTAGRLAGAWFVHSRACGGAW